MNNNLIENYQKRLKLQDAKFHLVDHADSIVAIVYKIVTADGKELILKICDQAHHYHREVYFLNYFAGKLPVSKIIDTIEPGPDLHGAVLMECLPGEILQKQQLIPEIARDIGSLLAKIHLNRTAEFGDLIQAESLMHDPIKYFAEKFTESFLECKEHLSDEVLDKCWKFYQENLNFLRSVDGPCIIHRDFRPGNVVASNGKISGIIDWASGRAGFAEDDICSLELGDWGTDANIKQAFLDGYSTIRPVPNYSEVMPLLLLNRAIAVVGYTVKIGTWNNRDAEFYKRNKKILEKVLK